jgi:putative phosphoribosyl transferase
MALFADRRDAGIRLGAVLRAGLVDVGGGGAVGDAAGDGGRPGEEDSGDRAAAGAGRLVLGLPRGGVVVAAEVALALGCPLDVLVVRKLGHPARPELGLGALAETGERVLNHALLNRLNVPDEVLDEVAAAEEIEARRRVDRYRAGRAPLEVSGHEVVVVDDGLATGYTALAAAESVARRGARRLVVAVPVGSHDSVAALETICDEVVCLACPPWLHAVGEAYDVFGDTSDDEVVAALSRAACA